MYKSKNQITKKVKYGKLKIYIIISILILALMFILVFKTNFFSIDEIIVKNNNEVSRDVIIAYSGIQLHNNIFKIKLSEITKKIEKNPYIKTAKVSRKLPNKIVIEVIERKRLAAIFYMGIYFIIDDEGYVLETKNKVKDVVVIEGFEINRFSEGEKIDLSGNEDLRKVLTLCSLIQKSNIDIKPKIYYNNGNINITIEDKLKVKFGNGENIDYKFKAFLSILKYLKSKDIYTGVIDISTNGYPVYRPFDE
ncbi:cell division protein FtsQ [Caminicella sporogenes DSM 14501]|uniref:Cell division protein FtsQ n=1 Tax=Caminicella sporogenes DSM 14501 TaxID=1121266 RepID=A0A1M6L1D9_9FIRM|nr:FtsQ-type POTRA domain-containing protein [Caminicella sporogenes]RKD27673.1 hypothetical protein BET04_00990 [Caminicella sporogenes]SHJ65051.1 cell division protein FtsQ [Caminicella sporogenes DSM 14501]